MLKGLFGGLCTAFSLYSVIPTPKTRWDSENMRYALCFFPLIGAVIALASLLWYGICARFGIVPGLYAAGAALIPLLISGGIHMDGFIDTADAIASHALREKKLEILKDSHVGAFGVLYCGGYLLLSFGLFQQLHAKPRLFLLAAAGYVLSRCANALSIATIPPAKASGLVRLFSDSAAKRAVVLCNLVVAGAVLITSTVLFPLWGGLATAVAVGYFALHRRFCLWDFGGNTGDLAGFLLQNMEILILAVAVLGGVAG